MLPIVRGLRPSQRLTPWGQEKAEVIEEVRRAQREWQEAERQFHDAMGEDQVDYAIYTLEAAEKKLDMLIRRAKQVWYREGRDAQSGGGDA